MPEVWVRRSVAAGPGERPHRRLQVERVLHVARRVLGRHVERFEVVVVVFELGTFDDEEAEAGEDRLDALAQQAQRMTVADGRRRPGSVTSTAPWADAPRGRCLDALTEDAFDVLLGGVGELPRRGRPRRRGAEGFEQRRDQPALPRQVFVAEGAEVGLRAGAGEILLELLAERFEGSDGSDIPSGLRGSGGCGAAFAAVFARCAKTAGLDTARSASCLRSIGIARRLQAGDQLTVGIPFSRAAALMRTTQSRRKSRFLRRRPTNAY
jgi:hypothetical protein